MPDAPPICHTGEGYEYVRCRAGEADDTVYIHRLLYVAEHGLEALPADYHVHHRVPIPLPTTPENLIAVDPDQHRRHHLHGEPLRPSP